MDAAPARRKRGLPPILLLVFLLLMSGWWGANVAEAAPPTFQAAGTADSGRKVVNPAWPVHAVDDIALLLVQTANNPVILSIPAGFVEVAGSPQGTGTAGGASATRLTVFWARATSTAMATPRVADSGNNQVAQIITFRGVFGTGNPWDVTAGDVLATASSAFSIPGATTTVTNALVVAIVANATDTITAQTSGWANVNLSGVVEVTDVNRSDGNGGGFAAATGIKAVAGAYGNTTGALATSSVQGRISIALRPKTTTLGDGINPGNVTLAPGAAINDLDAFTLQTSNGTDSVTALTVTLTGANSFQALSEVRITSSTGTTTYFTAVANPASNTVLFSGGTPIPVTSTLTTFKVRITPRTHANMPVPPGLSYAIGGTVTAFTVTNEKLGSDAASATLTVDNLSPASATAVSASVGNQQVTLNWTTSISTDFSRSVVLRWTGAAGAEVPAEGTDYVPGNAIGGATTVCVRTTDAASTAVSGIDGGGGNCSATALVNGQAYSYRIFQKDSNGNYDTGVTVGTFTPEAAVGDFNAYETGTAAGAITGVIKTKVAGTSFNLDLIALNSAKDAILTTFTGTVKVELLNSSGGGTVDANGCNAGWPIIQTLATNPVFVAGNSGRKTVSFQENNAWRNVLVRISFPATGTATATGCSSNNFAIRPSAFASVSVSDQDWQTAGTARTLTNSGASGGNVHKAGQPFTLRATAVNAVAATTTNYADTPTPVLSACVGAGCTTTFGTFNVGAATVAGVINSTTASYNEVGAFALQLQDQAFASVDAADTAGDCTAAGRYVCSPTFDVGRFVPDRFVLAGTNIPVLRTFNDATCTSRSFTYIGQPFGYVTAPQALVTAQNAAGDTTSNYQGSLWKLVATDLTQTYAYTLTPVSTPGLDTALIGVPTVTSSNNGTGTATAGSGDRLTFTRSLTSPLAPFTANITLTTSVVDSSENGVAGNGTIVTATPALFNGGGSGIAFDSGNAFRYGRLRLANAHGWELLPLPVPMQAQHWNGTGFVANTVDNCTTIAAANIAMGNYQGNLAACETAIAISGRLIAGNGNLTLLAPGAGNTGSVDLTVNLGTTVLGTTCLVVGGAGPADTPANLPHLRGAWSGTSYSENPSVRAGFGLREGSRRQIYRREVIGGN